MNRGDKLYQALSTPFASSIANNMGDKVNLPVALESIQKYAKYSVEKKNAVYSQRATEHVPALSVIYEIIRNKAPELYSPHNKGSKPDLDVEILPCVSNE